MILHRAAIVAWLKWDASGLFEWLAKRPWYTRILSEWVAAIPIESGDHALEVGCGPGLLSARVQRRGARVTGLDRSPAMLERARTNAPDCAFVEGDALAIPLADDAVDVAFAASVVNVVSDAGTLLSEMARVVRPGGRVSALFPIPRFSLEADAVAERRGLTGMSRAALMTWAGKAPKREPDAIEAVFHAAGLLDVRVDLFFDACVAGVTGRVA